MERDENFGLPIEDRQVPDQELGGGITPFWREQKFLLLLVFFVGIGLLTGWFLSTSRLAGKQAAGGAQQQVAGEKVRVGKVYGKEDGVFKDKAVGVIQKNEDGDVGTHKLLREGGESQTVYLTSSVLDLDMFIGHKVEVWGQTFSSEKVGWLMDIGRVKVLK
jgi:hypothetical protein